MGKKVKRYRNRIELFLAGERGARFFNFAYSIGAAIVIWGALFKILHLPGGNLLLAIGMGTEVLMFILTAFDRPYRQPEWTSARNEDTEVHHSEADQPHYVAMSFDRSTSQQIPSHHPALEPVAQVSESYVDEMDRLVKELAHLRETTAALNTLYELQLKSVSAQLGNIESSGRDISMMRQMMEQSARQSEDYCRETEQMTRNLATLNDIYAGMIAAMGKAK